MTDNKWPTRSRSVCEFFESLGIDPHPVLEDGVNEQGYRRLIKDDHGNRQYTWPLHLAVAEFVPWPNGVSDFRAFQVAHNEDDVRVNELAETCPECGAIDLESLI